MNYDTEMLHCNAVIDPATIIPKVRHFDDIVSYVHIFIRYPTLKIIRRTCNTSHHLRQRVFKLILSTTRTEHAPGAASLASLGVCTGRDARQNEKMSSGA